MSQLPDASWPFPLHVRLPSDLRAQVLVVHKAFVKRKRPLYTKRQEAISKIPEFWLKVVSGPLTLQALALVLRWGSERRPSAPRFPRCSSSSEVAYGAGPRTVGAAREESHASLKTFRTLLELCLP